MVTAVVGDEVGVLAGHPAKVTAVTRSKHSTVCHGWRAGKVAGLVERKTYAISGKTFSIMVKFGEIGPLFYEVVHDISVSEEGSSKTRDVGAERRHHGSV